MTQSAAGSAGAPPDIAAGLVASALYGLAASYAHRKFQDRPPLELAAGSVGDASIAMLLLAACAVVLLGASLGTGLLGRDAPRSG